jgi:hypothetical protein
VRKPITASEFRTFVAERDDLDALRIRYCYEIGSTFVSLALMEDAIVNAMSICDRVKLTNLLGPVASDWSQMIDKRDRLQSSTLGNLIVILSKHDIARADLEYLRWVKAKRDFYVHRFFHQGSWPGDLGDVEISVLCRRLRYLAAVFARASHRIWRIFQRANLMGYEDLGQDGILMNNLDLFKGDDDILRE